jgi:hypothetical protein
VAGKITRSHYRRDCHPDIVGLVRRGSAPGPARKI